MGGSEKRILLPQRHHGHSTDANEAKVRLRVGLSVTAGKRVNGHDRREPLVIAGVVGTSIEIDVLRCNCIDHGGEAAGGPFRGDVVNVRHLDTIDEKQVLHRIAAANDQIITEVVIEDDTGQYLQVPREVAMGPSRGKDFARSGVKCLGGILLGSHAIRCRIHPYRCLHSDSAGWRRYLRSGRNPGLVGNRRDGTYHARSRIRDRVPMARRHCGLGRGERNQRQTARTETRHKGPQNSHRSPEGGEGISESNNSSNSLRSSNFELPGSYIGAICVV